MAKVVEIDGNILALSQFLQVPISDIEVKPYGFDKRIGWETYIVTVRGEFVAGFIDEMPILDETFSHEYEGI